MPRRDETAVVPIDAASGERGGRERSKGERHRSHGPGHHGRHGPHRSRRPCSARSGGGSRSSCRSSSSPMSPSSSSSLRIGTLYVISGVGGSLLSSLFMVSNISVGASGALFGLLGSMLSELITNWTIYENKIAALMTLVMIIVINLAVGILPHVDNFAHLGGFTSGFFLGFVLLMRPQFGYINQKKSPLGHPMGVTKRKFKIYQIILFVIALVILISGFTVGLVLLFQGFNASEHCSWCHYLSCVPTSKWSCKAPSNYCMVFRSTGSEMLNGEMAVRDPRPPVQVLCNSSSGLAAMAPPRSNCRGEFSVSSSRSSIKHLYDVLSSFDENKKRLVRNAGFGGLLYFPPLRQINRRFAVWLMSRVDPLEHTLIIDASRRIKFERNECF
ncbi:RHOMBOID-like protein 1 [Panicum miliaceum]|uniref:RHOMBOID-like protein n=1 Tax=Panicum miliaceum TaxID=4540 RepID=A0A3L6SV34_PANMI|nr:RHOMBOID-like protein 1 [Panicum miliaceum]